MEHIALASFGSVLILLAAGAVWYRTREPGFLVGGAALFYWSVFGGFVFIRDQMQGNIPKYSWVFETTFPVRVDDDYYLTIAYYCAFVLFTLLGVLALSHDLRPSSITAKKSLLPVSHGRILVLAVVAIYVAFELIRKDLLTASLQNISVYAATRAGEENQAYNFRMIVHQMLTQIGIAAVGLGWAIRLSSAAPRFLVARSTRTLDVLYVLASIAVGAFCLLIGRKNELFFGVLFGTVLYLGNHVRPRYGWVFVGGSIGLVVLGLIDAVRGYSVASFLYGDAANFTELLAGGLGILGSTESVGSHFSLYGVIHWHVPLVYGASFVSLAAAVVPRILWPSRPGDIYPHFVEHLGLPTDVGYSMHHVTGWYLNLGPLGVPIGALVLAGVWTAMWRLRQGTSRSGNAISQSVRAVAFAGFTASLPSMLRAGIEGYKGAIMMGVVFPALLVWIVLDRETLSVFRRKVPSPASDTLERSRVSDCAIGDLA